MISLELSSRPNPGHDVTPARGGPTALMRLTINPLLPFRPGELRPERADRVSYMMHTAVLVGAVGPSWLGGIPRSKQKRVKCHQTRPPPAGQNNKRSRETEF